MKAYQKHPYVSAALFGVLLGVSYMLVVCYIVLPTP